jgi:hypothetical protein
MADLVNYAQTIHQSIVAYSPYLLGVSGVEIVKEWVSFLHEQLKVPSKLLPLASILSGIALNLIVGYYLKVQVFDSVVIGAVAGWLASQVHNVLK